MDIQVNNVTRTFGSVRANDAVCLHFAAGQIHGVLGENGAGKSTLMKLLSGFLRPDAGQIRLDQQVVSFASPGDALRAGVGMVHQEPLDVPAFTALENLLCAAPRWALPTRAEARSTLVVLAGTLGFTVEPETPIRSMTVGQRQQLEIIRLLACGARTIILDEPTTGISAAQARALFAALRKLANDGNTILFVSHKLDEVSSLCDTVSVLRAGRVVGEQMPMPVPQTHMLEMMFGDTSGQPAATTMPVPAVANGQPAVWELNQVLLRGGALALANLSVTIRPGQIVGLAGLEGSGQHLLLQALAGRLRPVAGQIRVHGQAIQPGAAQFLDQGIHYLPADRLADGMIGAFSLAEHFALQQRNQMLVNPATTRSAAQHAIEQYNIKATPNLPIAALSGGNQQRAMLALLPAQCRGMLLEQPTRGLDVTSASAIWERLHARAATGTAIVFATADLDELLAHSDTIMVFFGGRISQPITRSRLTEARLAELIGGVGFKELAMGAST